MTVNIMRFVFRLLLVVALLNAGLILSLRWIDPPTSAFMLWDRLGNDRKLQYQWVPLTQISPHLHITVVAAEDQKFPAHFGFDFESMADALAEDTERRRGASTITQQLAKNLFLWSGHSYLRKGIEAYCAALIELFWPKRRILEMYLNIAEFGPGIYGAEAASRAFYGQPAAALNPYQSALLAAVLPNPKRMSVARPSRYVHNRAWEILVIAEDLGGAGYLAGM